MSNPQLHHVFSEAAAWVSSASLPTADMAEHGACFMATAVACASGDRPTYDAAATFAAAHGFPILNAFAYVDFEPGIERQSAIFDGLTLLSLLAGDLLGDADADQ